MSKSILSAAALIVLSGSAVAVASPANFSDGFESVTTSMNTTPPGWTSVNGTVDTIAQGNGFGLSCFSGSPKGCIDLDGSSNLAGVFTTINTFDLEAGKTYQLSAEISGNQRNSGTDGLQFGFTSDLSNPLANIVQSAQINSIAADSPFTLYTLLFTPTSNVTAHAFFYNLLGGDNQGLILDAPSLKAVPLPAAAWLLLSGLVALGAVARRRRIAPEASAA